MDKYLAYPLLPITSLIIIPWRFPNVNVVTLAERLRSAADKLMPAAVSQHQPAAHAAAVMIQHQPAAVLSHHQPAAVMSHHRPASLLNHHACSCVESSCMQLCSLLVPAAARHTPSDGAGLAYAIVPSWPRHNPGQSRGRLQHMLQRCRGAWWVAAESHAMECVDDAIALWYLLREAEEATPIVVVYGIRPR
jgi:hypothetical protein